MRSGREQAAARWISEREGEEIRLTMIGCGKPSGQWSAVLNEKSSLCLRGSDRKDAEVKKRRKRKRHATQRKRDFEREGE